MSLSDRVLAGETRAIARAISLLEDEDADGTRLIRDVFGRTGRARLIGVTGSPGAGKSTLVDRLISDFRSGGATVGVLAVDPTSPFSGGAVLGDRLRMQAHAGDAGVFIRSMATRGHLGGLAGATADAALVLDAAGTNIVIIETVGVGQDEIDIVRVADLSIVMLVPGTGDEVQALKAGIMEIADIFVLNKADREGSDRLVTAVEMNLSLHAYHPEDWRPPVVKTVATNGEGVPELIAAIAKFQAHAEQRVESTGTSAQGTRRRGRYEQQLREIVTRRFLNHLERDVMTAEEWRAIVDRIAARDIDPYSAGEQLLTRAGLKTDSRRETPPAGKERVTP